MMEKEEDREGDGGDGDGDGFVALIEDEGDNEAEEEEEEEGDDKAVDTADGVGCARAMTCNIRMAAMLRPSEERR